MLKTPKTEFSSEWIFKYLLILGTLLHTWCLYFSSDYTYCSITQHFLGYLFIPIMNSVWTNISFVLHVTEFSCESLLALKHSAGHIHSVSCQARHVSSDIAWDANVAQVVSDLYQGSRVWPIWSHMQPDFSVVKPI